MNNVVRYPFEMLAELRLDVAILTHAWDRDQLSESQKRQLRFALELFQLGATRERIAFLMAIFGTVAEDVRRQP